MSVMEVDKMKEIIKIATKLGWINSKVKSGYPTMQLSEVEKCMLAMSSDFQFERMKKWEKEEYEKGSRKQGGEER